MMPDYDGTLKLLLRKSAQVAVRHITGSPIQKWLDVELPDPRSLRLDLLGETADRSLVHLELQSSNDPAMAFPNGGVRSRHLPAVRAISSAVLPLCGRAAAPNAGQASRAGVCRRVHADRCP